LPPLWFVLRVHVLGLAFRLSLRAMKRGAGALDEGLFSLGRHDHGAADEGHFETYRALQRSVSAEPRQRVLMLPFP
jgi:hypothetical protein